MKLIILNDYDQASEWAAKYIRNRILLFQPGPEKYFTLGLPTGEYCVKKKKDLKEYSSIGGTSTSSRTQGHFREMI